MKHALILRRGGSSAGLASLRNLSLLLGAVLSFAFLPAPIVSAAAVYDATAAFVEPSSGALANPNGVWSYGHTQTKTGGVTLFTTAQYFTQSNAFGFSITGATGNPAHVPNILKAKQNIAGAAIGQLAMHSGLDPNEFAALVFTTPTAGLYNLGITWGAGNSGAVSVYAFRSGSLTALVDITGTTVGGFLPTTTLSLAAGETVQLRIGRAGGISSDQTPVTMTLTAVPEPTSIAILGAGACGLLGFIRRRRK